MERNGRQFKARGVGMSSKHGPKEPLLSTFRDNDSSKARAVTKSKKSGIKGPSRPREDVAVDAPPISSDDEEPSPKKDATSNDPIDSDSEGEPARAAIPRTTFTENSTSASTKARNALERGGMRVKKVNAKSGSSRPQPNEQRPKTGSKRSAQDADLDSTRKTGDVPEWMAGEKPKVRAPQRKYGGSQSQRSSQSSAPSSSAPKPTEPKAKAGPKLKVYDRSPTPEESLGDKPKLRMPEMDSSPRKKKKKIELKKPDMGDDDDGMSRKKRPAKLKKHQESPPPKEVSKPKLNLPSLSDLKDLAKDYDISISGTRGELVEPDELEDSELFEDTLMSSTSRCPMCRKPVDPELLAKHTTKSKRMNVREQAAFCRLHQRNSLLESGNEQGYPTEIDWDSLATRLEPHLRYVQDILEGKRASTFADALRAQVEAGRERTLLKTTDSLTPGYYGPRGLRFMAEFLGDRLADVMRRRAVEDPLISARGHAGYVQAVLVQELAVRLILDDGTAPDEDRARAVLRESAALGDLLHEEIGDDIREFRSNSDSDEDSDEDDY